MKIKRNLVYLLLFLYYVVFMYVLILKAADSRGDYINYITPIIPIENYLQEKVIITLVLYPLGAILGIALGYIIIPLFLAIHVKVFGKNLTYGIQEYNSPHPDKLLLKSLFPVLMAIFLAMSLSTNEVLIQAFVYPADQAHLSYPRTYYPVFVVTLIFTIPLSIGLFSAQWGLNDAGFVYYNSKKVKIKGKGRIIEGRSLGSAYKTLLAGYAGIGVLFTFYDFIFIISDGFSQAQAFLIPFILTDFLTPIYLTISTIPALILYDKMKGVNARIMKKIAKKLNIFERWTINYEIVEGAPK